MQQRIQDLERQAYELAVLQQNTIEAVRVDDDDEEDRNQNASNSPAAIEQTEYEQQQQHNGEVDENKELMVEVIQAGNIQTVADARKQKRQKLMVGAAAAFVVIVAIIVSVAVVTGSEGQSSGISSSPTPVPTDAPTTTTLGRLDYIMSVLQDYLEYDFIVQIESNPLLLKNIGSPQGQALYWLTEVDSTTILNNNRNITDLGIELGDYVNIVQRYALAVYYYANINADPETYPYWENSNWTKPGVSVCKWFGVDCKGSSDMNQATIDDSNTTNSTANVTTDSIDDSETVVRLLTDRTSFLQYDFSLLIAWLDYPQLCLCSLSSLR